MLSLWFWTTLSWIFWRRSQSFICSSRRLVPARATVVPKFPAALTPWMACWKRASLVWTTLANHFGLTLIE
jgi:hypothetical protein